MRCDRPSSKPIAHADLRWITARAGPGKPRSNAGDAAADATNCRLASEHFLQRAEHDFDAFLFRQPADVAKQRNAGVHRQAEFLCNSSLFAALPLRSSRE